MHVRQGCLVAHRGSTTTCLFVFCTFAGPERVCTSAVDRLLCGLETTPPPPPTHTLALAPGTNGNRTGLRVRQERDALFVALLLC